jgi:hypothetical protein
MDAWLLVIVGLMVIGGLALIGRTLGRIGALDAMGEGWLRATGAGPRRP